LLQEAPAGTVCEIGCARHEVEIPSEGSSTLYLSRACVEAQRHFLSCDVDPVAVDVANALLARGGLPSVVVLADGVELLRSAGPLALLYLDSSEDPTDAEAQLAAAEMLPGGIVVIDDAQMVGRHVMGRATLVGNYFARRGLPFEIHQTEPGFAAMILRFPDGKLGLVMP
jgi:predicted O-methyltransferase YrrM